MWAAIVAEGASGAMSHGKRSLRQRWRHNRARSVRQAGLERYAAIAVGHPTARATLSASCVSTDVGGQFSGTVRGIMNSAAALAGSMMTVAYSAFLDKAF